MWMDFFWRPYCDEIIFFVLHSNVDGFQGKRLVDDFLCQWEMDWSGTWCQGRAKRMFSIFYCSMHEQTEPWLIVLHFLGEKDVKFTYSGL